jgi:hypothetical protein
MPSHRESARRESREDARKRSRYARGRMPSTPQERAVGVVHGDVVDLGDQKIPDSKRMDPSRISEAPTRG